jgi:hypothetical protein
MAEQKLSAGYNVIFVACGCAFLFARLLIHFISPLKWRLFKINFRPMKKLVIALLAFSTSVFAQDEHHPLEGAWDLNVTMENRNGGASIAPSWLEVRHSGLKTLTGRFVGDGGSARPISEVFYKNGHISFKIPPQWDKFDPYMSFEGDLKDGKLSGTIVKPNGKPMAFTGRRAPTLWRTAEPVWDKPITLFNGKDLSGWHALGTKKNQWIVENGALKSPESGANICTDQKFTDFKLHIEFRLPPGSNSGVYLRGRYEAQVEDSFGKAPYSIYLGGIYGFLDPLIQAAKPSGEWQTYDIILVGRKVSVTLNGQKVIIEQNIPGITGGAMDSDEENPGPIMFQGDHGPVEYRNIEITPAK